MRGGGGQEMKELAALAYRDTTPESRDFWKNEMAQAIREIEQMYADKLETMKTEMESSYNLKVSLSLSLSLSPSISLSLCLSVCLFDLCCRLL